MYVENEIPNDGVMAYVTNNDRPLIHADAVCLCVSIYKF
jgi:hypothetical protein